jgi:hypothetical protein
VRQLTARRRFQRALTRSPDPTRSARSIHFCALDQKRAPLLSISVEAPCTELARRHPAWNATGLVLP